MYFLPDPRDFPKERSCGSIFNYAGIGNLAVESVKYHAYNLLMIDVLITGFIVFLSSFVAQTVNEEIDPRMKDSEVRVW